MLYKTSFLFAATLLIGWLSLQLLQTSTESHELWVKYEQVLAKWEEARVKNPNLLPPDPPPAPLAAQDETVQFLSAGITSILWGLWRTVLNAKYHRAGAWFIALFFVGGAALGMLIGGADLTFVLLETTVMLLVVVGGLQVGSTFAERVFRSREGV